MKRTQPRKKKIGPWRPTSQEGSGWQNVAGWYSSHLEGAGTYQEQLIFPNALRLLAPRKGGSYLDIACGEGSFAAKVAAGGAKVVGIDAAQALIEKAKRRRISGAEFLVGDAQQYPAQLRSRRFDGAACVLAAQNIPDMKAVFVEAAAVLGRGAPLVIVLNHPAFRIPRQSEWGWDETKKTEYRRLDRYMTPMEIPILMNPGDRGGRRVTTMSYHRPLGAYFAALAEAGFAVDALEEWVSARTTEPGPRARGENRARAEFPLFLALRARKA